jgi:hypothetical protein
MVLPTEANVAALAVVIVVAADVSNDEQPRSSPG